MKIGVAGATGRLGTRVVSTAMDRGWEVVVTANSESWLVKDIPEVLLDVSDRAGLSDVVSFCQANGVPLVEGVSGLSSTDLTALRRLAETTAVVQASNFSPLHHLQLNLLNSVDWKELGERNACQVVVVDRHPTTKKDRPSATAKRLETQCKVRTDRPVRVESLRMGGPVSDHDVVITLEGEQLRLSHSVWDLAPAVSGALQCMEWAAGRRSGYWTTEDVYRADGVRPSTGVGGSRD